MKETVHSYWGLKPWIVQAVIETDVNAYLYLITLIECRESIMVSLES